MTSPSPTPEAADAGLRKSLDLGGVVALGLGSAVGVSIFSALAPASALAGPGMLISVLIAGVPMFLIAISYAFLGSTVAVSGASYEWPARFIHPTLGFFITWLRIVANMGAMVVLALVLVRYASMIIPLPTKPTMFVLFALALLSNLFGVHIASRVQKVLMTLLVLLFLVFIGWGATTEMDLSRIAPIAPHGWMAVVTAAPLLAGLFFGIEAATEAGDEVSNSRRTIPLGIALSIGSATILYLAVAIVALGVLGGDGLAGSDAPILDAATQFMGPVAKPLIVVAAVAACGKSLNALFTLFSRSLFAMARAGVLPSALAKVHPQWKTPYMALLTVFAMGCVGLLLPMELTFLFLAVNIPNLCKYGCICIAAARVTRHHPDLYDRAGFKLAKKHQIAIAFTGAASALVLIIAGFEADWRPYGLLVCWGAVGAVYYIVKRMRTRAASAP